MVRPSRAGGSDGFHFLGLGRSIRQKVSIRHISPGSFLQIIGRPLHLRQTIGRRRLDSDLHFTNPRSAPAIGRTRENVRCGSCRRNLSPRPLFGRGTRGTVHGRKRSHRPLAPRVQRPRRKLTRTPNSVFCISAFRISNFCFRISAFLSRRCPIRSFRK